jgi:crotonobetainyl-CoA:carnitine CoA-transferase CaiB-like acyl-CoA transferase
MFQVGVALMPESWLHYQATGTEVARRGAQDLTSRLSGVFESSEPDTWVAISLRDQRDLSRLGQLIPDLPADPSQCRVVIEDWARTQSPDDAVEALQALRIPAGRVMSIRDLLHDRNLRRRGFYVDVDLGEDIGHRPIIGRPFTFVEHRADGPRIQGRAPRFGEHNRSVLADLLGLDEAAIGDLYEAGIVADVPRNPPVGKPADMHTLIAKGSLGSVDPNFKASLRKLALSEELTDDPPPEGTAAP